MCWEKLVALAQKRPIETSVVTSDLQIRLAEVGIDRVALLKAIKELHADVDGSVLESWRKNLTKMIQLGSELTVLRDDVGHGAWLKWLRANATYLGFGEDTAERYMRLYRNRELLQQPDSAHVRNLTDALILIKEPDPDKRKALLDEAARTGKSIRSAKKRVKKGQKQFSDPKRTAATDGLCALGIEYEVAAQWAELAEGETVEDLIKDALRRRTLALEVPKEASDVSKPETAGDTDKPKTEERPAAPPKVQEPIPRPESPADKKFHLSEFGDFNDIGTFDSVPVKLELTPMEFKILNLGLNRATPTNEKEICAVKFLHSYNTRYTAVKRTTGAAPSDPKPKSPTDDQQSQNGSDKPEIAAGDLSLTAQQKLDLAIQQHKAKLDEQFHAAVNARVQEFLENTIMPKLQAEQAEARRVMESRKGIMDKKAFRKIVECLHSDRVIDPVLKPKYDEAFIIFKGLEKRLLDEKNSPTQFVMIPETRAEWDELRRQVSERRKSKRHLH
jgi:hypothetical protein